MQIHVYWNLHMDTQTSTRDYVSVLRNKWWWWQWIDDGDGRLTAAGGERSGLLLSDKSSSVVSLRMSHGMWAMRLQEKSRCRRRSRQMPTHSIGQRELQPMTQSSPISLSPPKYSGFKSKSLSLNF